MSCSLHRINNEDLGQVRASFPTIIVIYIYIFIYNIIYWSLYSGLASTSLHTTSKSESGLPHTQRNISIQTSLFQRLALPDVPAYLHCSYPLYCQVAQVPWKTPFFAIFNCFRPSVRWRSANVVVMSCKRYLRSVCSKRDSILCLTVCLMSSD